jgi:hypothetical protein
MIPATQLFGNFTDTATNSSEEYLVLGFTPGSIPLQQRWRNNGLSADFLADYLVTFFPINDLDPTTFAKRNEIQNAVSYIANELLENAMKFNDVNSNYPISIRLDLHHNRITFAVTNSIPAHSVAKFQTRIQELLNTDPQELYINQLEKNIQETEVTSSSLGLLTMLTDYMAKLGWKFESLSGEREVMVVTTMVELPV